MSEVLPDLDLYPNAGAENLAAEIEKEFDQLEYHQPTEAQINQIARIRSLYKMCAKEIIMMMPNSRERSLALTQNQTAMMLAVKAVIFA